jgi:hypothetical protein
MTVTYVWRYMSTGTVKHALREDQMVQFSDQASICGRAPLWFLPKHETWDLDPVELNRRDECKSCVGIIKKLNLNIARVT